MLKTHTPHTEDPEVIALKALGFLASDEERLVRFLDVTGLSPQAIRQQAGQPAFLGGILDYLLADQTLLFMFAESEALQPARIEAARRKLPGAQHDF